MKHIRSAAVLALFAALTSGGAAMAQTSPWAAGATVGSDGLGLDLKYSLNPSVVLRARGTGLDISHSENSDGIHYAGKAKLTTGGAFVDWHPFPLSGFLLSAGVVAGQRRDRP